MDKYRINWIKAWIKAAGVRALKTVSQTAIATIGATKYFGDVDWGMVWSCALLAGLLSLLTSLAGLPEVEKFTPNASENSDNSAPEISSSENAVSNSDNFYMNRFTSQK